MCCAANQYSRDVPSRQPPRNERYRIGSDVAVHDRSATIEEEGGEYGGVMDGSTSTRVRRDAMRSDHCTERPLATECPPCRLSAPCSFATDRTRFASNTHARHAPPRITCTRSRIVSSSSRHTPSIARSLGSPVPSSFNSHDGSHFFARFVGRIVVHRPGRRPVALVGVGVRRSTIVLLRWRHLRNAATGSSICRRRRRAQRRCTLRRSTTTHTAARTEERRIASRNSVIDRVDAYANVTEFALVDHSTTERSLDQ
jgi:hypothetical protein